MTSKRSLHGLAYPVLTALLVWPINASAQTVSDPREVDFHPSELHSSPGPDGRPYVTRYDLEFYYPGATEPFQVVNLGKPAPDPDGIIRAIFITVPFSWPASGVTYVARVASVGPFGIGRSDASNAFIFGGRCNYVLSSSAQTFPSAGGPGSVSIYTAPGCSWAASSSASWADVANSTGSDTAIITFAVRANSTRDPRVATIVVAGQTLTLTQADAASERPVPPVPVPNR